MTGVNLNVPVMLDPKDTVAFTSISGYLKIWYPLPFDWIFTNFCLTKSVVTVPAMPTLISLKAFSFDAKIEYLSDVDKPTISVPVQE